MFTDMAKKAEFQKADFEDWNEAVLRSLKHSSIEDFYRESYEGIKLFPLYTREQKKKADVDQYPGMGLLTRGFRDDTAGNPWLIAQRASHPDWNELKKILLNSFNMGQEALSFDPDKLNNIKDVNFAELHIHQAPLLIFSNYYFDSLSDKLLEIQDQRVAGALATDVAASAIADGWIIDPDSEYMHGWRGKIVELSKRFPELRTILIDAAPFKESGGHVVHELGIALALGVFYIEQMKKEGWEPKQTIGKMVFRFATGSHFFMEVCKYRAFRTLWKTVTDAYGVSREESAVKVSAETAEMTKSVLDPHVNILRAGNEAFAAVLGGVDFLHVAPFDGLAEGFNEFSARLARNTQLLLKEESHLDKVTDPAGGSYYIESLTRQLVSRGWSFFQKIDREGGIIESFQSGWIQKEIKEIAGQRLADAETRKLRAVGVNVYAMSDEKVTFPEAVRSSLSIGSGRMEVDSLPKIRIAEKFEGLRKRAKELLEKGVLPKAGLICLGELKGYKPYSDFISGVLAAGGIQAELSGECHSLEDIQSFIKRSDLTYFCLCGPEDLYDRFAGAAGSWLRRNCPGIHIDLAGKRSADSLAEMQLDGCIYPGQNIYKKLDALLNRWEGR